MKAIEVTETLHIQPRDRLTRPRDVVAGARRLVGAGASRFTEADLAVRRHRRSLLVLLALLAVTGAFHAFGMYQNPQVIDDEGTYVAQAWAVANFGELAHYTYWYDHPPLGWLQLAAYTELTWAFDRVEHAIYAGRELLLLTQLISAGLLWALCRRLNLARWSSAIAVGVFALSPLAIQFHRVVFLDNIAMPWILGSLVLAASPKRRMAELAGSAICFAVAVLTKETTLLLLPALALLMWQSTDRATRRYTLAVATSLFVAIGSAYVLFAVIKGELVAGSDRVSLFEGLRFQLLGRDAGGSVLDAGSLNRRTLELWLSLDWLTPGLATLIAPMALLVRRLRPFAVGYLVMLGVLLRPGYLPVPFVIAVLPLAAILIGGIADEGWKRRQAPAWLRPAARLHRPFAPGVILLGAAALVAAIPLWGVQHRGLLLSDPNRPVLDATAWIIDNVQRDRRLIVDDVFYVDLVEAGFDRSNVVWAYKVDTDPAVQALSPRGWRDYDYLVQTDAMRRGADTGLEVSGAVENSVVVARFGQGDGLVEIHRIIDGGAHLPPDEAEIEADRILRARVGTALEANPGVLAAPLVADALRAGAVDERLMVVVAAAAQSWDLTVSHFPVVHGEQEIDSPRRVAVLTGINGERAWHQGDGAAFQSWLDGQSHLGVVATPTDEGLAISVPPALPGQARVIARSASAATAQNQEEPS